MKKLLALIAFLSLTFPADAAITLDAAATSVAYANTATSVSNTTQTVGTASDRVCVAIVVMTNKTPTNQTMTWDSSGTKQAMTLLQEKTFVGGPGSRVEIWGLINPTSGTKTLTYSFTGTSTEVFLSSICFNGVHQTTAFTGAAGYNGSASSPSFPSSASSGQASVGVTSSDSGLLSAPTQTSIYIDNTRSVLDAAAAYNIGSAAPTFAWTDSAPAANNWAGAVVSLVPSDSSPPPPPPPPPPSGAAQMVTVTANSGAEQLPSLTLNIADPAVNGGIDCPTWNASSLVTAAGLGYTINGASYTDPATGVTITQGCDDAALYVQNPPHPFASGFPTVSPVTAPTINANTAILFVIGQSNASMNGSGGYVSGSKQTFDYSGTAFYSARDPLHNPGEVKPDGSPWVLVADGLIGKTGINGQRIHKVIIMARSLGGSTIGDWISGGEAHSHLNTHLASLSALVGSNGPSVYVIWQQGEGDTGFGATASAYETKFASLRSTIQSYTSAPIYVSKTTTCIPRSGAPDDFTYSPSTLVGKAAAQRAIRLAQTNVVNGTTVRAGPDNDAIPPIHRWDGCHIGGYGLVLGAQGWIEALH